MRRFGAVTALVIVCVFICSALVADGQARRGVAPSDGPRGGGPAGRGRKEGPGPGKPPGIRGPHRPTTQPRHRSLTEAQEKELLAVLKEKRPELYKRLKDMKERDKDTKRLGYRWMVQAMWGWYQKWKNLPKPIQDAWIDEHDAKVEAWRLAQEMRKATSESEKEEIIAKLRTAVAKQFDAEQKVRGYRLTQLEEQLAQAREDLKARAKRRAEVIDELVERVIKGASRLSKMMPKGQPGHVRKPKAERDEPKRRAPGGKDHKAGV